VPSGRLPLILVVIIGLAWGTVAQRRVKSLGIVAEPDVPGHILAGVFPRRVGGAVDALDFERGIERFREGIIEAGPTLPTDWRTSSRAAASANAWLRYCEPWSLWNIASGCSW
jgi:hypothetical protein